MEISENEFKIKIWYYYKMIEEDFLSTKNTVLIDECNFNVVGLRFLNIIEACCSEIDTLLRIAYKEVIKKHNIKNVDVNKDNIHKLWYFLQNELLINEKGNIYNMNNYEISNIYGIKLKPWSNYSANCDEDKRGNVRYNGKNLPKWWSDYNKLKHNRILNDSSGKPYFTKANLKNALYSLAGLYVLLLGLINFFGFNDILLLIDSGSKLFVENSAASGEEVEKMLGIAK